MKIRSMALVMTAIAGLLLAPACGGDPATPPGEDTDAVSADGGHEDAAQADVDTTDGPQDIQVDTQTDAAGQDADAGDTEADAPEPPDVVSDAQPDDGTTSDVADAGQSDGADASDVSDAVQEDVADAGAEDVADAGAADAADADVPTGPVCDPPCADGQLCAADGVCLTDCGEGFDAQALMGALAPGWDVTADFCGLGFGAWAFTPLDDTTLLELRTTDLGGDPAQTNLVLSSTDLSADGGPATTVVATVTVDGSPTDYSMFPGGAVAVSSDGALAAFTATGAFAPGGPTPGWIFFAALNDPTVPVVTVDAPDIFAVAHVSGDEWLVNASGVAGTNDGPGLYVLTLSSDGAPAGVKIAGNLGTNTGPLGVYGDVVLAGGYADPWPSQCGDNTVNDGTVSGSKTFSMSLGALQAMLGAGGTTDLFCDGTEVPVASQFRLDDGVLLAQNAWMGTYLTVYDWTEDQGAVSVTGSTPLTVDLISEGASIPGTGDFLLRHASGYLRVTPSAAAN